MHGFFNNYFGNSSYNFCNIISGRDYNMNPIEEIKQEHEDIERELIELETIKEDEEINYPDLIHTFKKLHNIWNKHEEKEEIIFPYLRKKEHLIIPVKEMLFEHRALKSHKDALLNAINSGSEWELKKILDFHGKIIIEKLRQHIKKEDEVLFTISLQQEFKPEDVIEMKKLLEQFNNK